MSNEIQQFDFKGATLRALTDENGEPWFCRQGCMRHPRDSYKGLAQGS